MKLSIKGNQAVIKGIRAYEKRSIETVKEELKNAVLKTEQEAKSETSGDAIEGLSQSINARISEEGLVGTVGSDLYEAPFREFGTGAKVQIPEGLEAYAMTFFITGEGTLPANPFLFGNARNNFREMMERLKRRLGK